MKRARSQLSWLESESIHILREAVAEARNPVMLGGKGLDRNGAPGAAGLLSLQAAIPSAARPGSSDR